MGIISTILSLLAIGLGLFIAGGIIGLIVAVFLIWKSWKLCNETKKDFKKG